jgi:hypothetical protein
MFLMYLGAMLILPAKWNPDYFPEIWRRRSKFLPAACVGLVLVAASKIGSSLGISLPLALSAALATAGLVLMMSLPLKLATEKSFFPILGRGKVSPFFKDLGAIRYLVVMVLVLSAIGLPAKMFCRLALPFHLKYVVVTPWFYI